MSRSRLAILLVVAGLLLPERALAQTDLKPKVTPEPSPSVSRPAARGSLSARSRLHTRIAIGEKAPDFELDRRDGTTLKLSRLRGDWVMLIFVERHESLEVVPSIARALSSVGVRTLAVTFDKPHVLARQFAGRTLEFEPLADPTGEITALYGLLGDGEAATPQPGFVLIDPRGRVKLALLGDELPGDDTSRLVLYAVQGD
jgi:peroxiredoxin